MLKLYENKTYLVKKEQHEKMLSEQRAASKELHQLKCKLEELNKNDLGKWPEIEATKKQYLKLQKEIQGFQKIENSHELYIDIVEEVKKEAIEKGLEINKKILEKLIELADLNQQYLNLQQVFGEYFSLTKTKTEDIQNVIGINTTYIIAQKNNQILVNFLNASKQYQDRHKK